MAWKAQNRFAAFTMRFFASPAWMEYPWNVTVTSQALKHSHSSSPMGPPSTV